MTYSVVMWTPSPLILLLSPQANGWDAADEGAGGKSEHVEEEMPQLAAITELTEIRVVESETLTSEQKTRVGRLFEAIDGLGDKNGKVDKAELTPLDKRGKLFAKLDTTRDGLITAEAFEAYFIQLASDRGEKGELTTSGP